MTKQQVKKAMTAAGITGELTGAGESWEVELPDEAAFDLFRQKVCQAGGYRTGYGSYVLRPGYKTSDLDACCPAHPMHY